MVVASLSFIFTIHCSTFGGSQLWLGWGGPLTYTSRSILWKSTTNTEYRLLEYWSLLTLHMAAWKSKTVSTSLCVLKTFFSAVSPGSPLPHPHSTPKKKQPKKSYMACLLSQNVKMLCAWLLCAEQGIESGTKPPDQCGLCTTCGYGHTHLTSFFWSVSINMHTNGTWYTIQPHTSITGLLKLK